MTTSTSPDREVISPEELQALREAVRDIYARHAGPDEARRPSTARPTRHRTLSGGRP